MAVRCLLSVVWCVRFLVVCLLLVVCFRLRCWLLLAVCSECAVFGDVWYFVVCLMLFVDWRVMCVVCRVLVLVSSVLLVDDCSLFAV